MHYSVFRRLISNNVHFCAFWFGDSVSLIEYLVSLCILSIHCTSTTIQSTVRPSVRSFIRSYVRSFVGSFVRLFVLSFVPPFVRSLGFQQLPIFMFYFFSLGSQENSSPNGDHNKVHYSTSFFKKS